MHLLNWVGLSDAPLPAKYHWRRSLATVLFGIWRVYPHLRGTDTMALGFSLWIPSTILLVAQGNVPLFASSICGSLLAICGYILLYRGLLSFLQVKGHLPILYDVAAVASAVIIYFTTIYDLALPRIIAISGGGCDRPRADGGGAVQEQQRPPVAAALRSLPFALCDRARRRGLRSRIAHGLLIKHTDGRSPVFRVWAPSSMRSSFWAAASSRS